MVLIKRFARSMLLAGIAVLLTALPVLAAVYSASFIITESSSNAYTMLGASVLVDNQYLADNGYMEADALDTRVETAGGIERPHMVVDDRTLTAVAVPADSQTNLYFTTGNADQNMNIVTGYNGYLTILDAAGLELGNNFEVAFDGYVDTSDSGSLIRKPSAFQTIISASGSITAGIIDTESFDVTPAVAGSWQDVDVSSVIGAGATGVVLQIDENGGLLGLRKKGSTDNRVKPTYHGWAVIGLDTNGEFQAYVTAGAAIYLVGYTDSSWTFNTNADDVTLGASGAWTDIDVSVQAPGATGVIIEAVSSAGVAKNVGLRKNGSTDNRTNTIYNNSHFFAVTGVDGSQILEGFTNAPISVDFFLIGYVTGGATFATNADDKSLVGINSWTDIDASVEAPGATHLIFEVISPGTTTVYGFRTNGSSESVLEAAWYHQWVVVKCDNNQIVEGYIGNVAIDFFLVGYVTSGISDTDAIISYTKSVTAAGVTSGEHTVTVTADGTDLKIFIDAVEEDTIALAGASVTDNANDWVISQNNVLPYLASYNHTVGGALVTRYEPNTMIIGTTLPDREVAGNDATITFGSNPAGVAVTLGGLVSTGQPGAGEEADAPIIDILPAAGGSDWFVEPDVSGTLLTNPLRPLVTMMSDTTSITELQAWRLLALAFILGVTVLAIYSVRGHLLIAGIASGAAIGLVVSLTIFPLWALVFAIGAILGGLISERSPSL